MSRKKKEVIYILGHGHDLDFAFKYAVPREYDGPLKLTVFDYKGNYKIKKDISLKIKQWENWSGKHPRKSKNLGKPTMDTKLLNFLKDTVHKNYIIHSSNYCKESQHPSKKETGTIVDLYNYIANREKQSIKSLQFFSHSTRYGPVLSNTSVRNEHRGSDERDPCDIDPRKSDFRDPRVLGRISSNRTDFRNAFSYDASIRSWGCQFYQRWRHYIRCYWNIFEGKRISCGEMSSSEREKYRKEAKLASKENSLIDRYIDKMQDSYAYELSTVIKKHVWGAPVGYGTGQFGKTYKGEWPIYNNDKWVRPNPKVLEDDMTRKFIKRKLKLRMDSAGYIAYHENMFDKYWEFLYSKKNVPK